MFRRRRRHESEAPSGGIELAQLEPRWRSAVEETLASQRRLRTLVDECETGPLRERLASLVERVDAGVVAAWKIASRAQATSRTLAAMDLDQVRTDLKNVRRRAADKRQGEADLSSLQIQLDALTEQHAVLSQLSNAVEDAAERLRLLDLRLDTAVARAAQIVLLPDAVEELGSVDQELATVVEELDALRSGLEAVRTLDR